jgi:hypothetical protein
MTDVYWRMSWFRLAWQKKTGDYPPSINAMSLELLVQFSSAVSAVSIPSSAREGAQAFFGSSLLCGSLAANAVLFPSATISK